MLCNRIDGGHVADMSLYLYCTSQVLWCTYDISATFSILLEMSDVM